MPFYQIDWKGSGTGTLSKPAAAGYICNARQVRTPTPIRRSRARPAGQCNETICGRFSPLPRLGLPKALSLDLLLAFLRRAAGLLAVGPGRR